MLTKGRFGRSTAPDEIANLEGAEPRVAFFHSSTCVLTALGWDSHPALRRCRAVPRAPRLDRLAERVEGEGGGSMSLAGRRRVTPGPGSCLHAAGSREPWEGGRESDTTLHRARRRAPPRGHELWVEWRGRRGGCGCSRACFSPRQKPPPSLPIPASVPSVSRPGPSRARVRAQDARPRPCVLGSIPGGGLLQALRTRRLPLPHRTPAPAASPEPRASAGHPRLMCQLATAEY